MASEMLYPIMPSFLKSIGFSALLIGIMEGIAEAVSGLSKGYFGQLSDFRKQRVIFVRSGYLISALGKSVIGLLQQPLLILGARSLDKVGKGLRTAARDAILSDHSNSETKARVFGFHRSFDSLGAAVGPTIGLLLLYLFPGNYKLIFLISFAPGIMATLLTFFLKDATCASNNLLPQLPAPSFFSFLRYWKKASREYRQLLLLLLLFTLLNSSDLFLLLHLKEKGMADPALIGIYIFFNIIYTLSSYPAGWLADRLGLKKIFISGLFLFSIAYIGIGHSLSPFWFFIFFGVYGLFNACNDGIAKAWICKLCSKGDTATALGTFMALQSMATLCSGILTGIFWQEVGGATVLIFTGISVIIFAALSLFLKEPSK